MNDPRDQFPIGMRVLAVDDDPTCLMVLETLLRRCQYHVTVTKNAMTALKLLRENKNKFDLVISDVIMPDMDGFKLLELVGLEMDLPVIMVSANDDPKMVMKGISHGACDYLLKPIRIEELKNIWQHVVRKKKIEPKERNKTSNQDMPNSGSYNAVESISTGNSDQNGKPTRKRKDQDEDEDDDDDDDEHENSHDNEDQSTQKKARVVWSVELHRKFVAAVNQLGIDKAVPKKILDLMNVEKLTRENVASHLQKYRLYLKRISCVDNQQANMAASLGSADSSYLRMDSLSGGVGRFQTLSGSGQFHNNAFRSSFPTSGMISRLNTPTGLNVHGLPSLNNSTNDQLKFQSAIGRGYPNGVQGMPTSVGLDQLQHNCNTLFYAKPTFPISNKVVDQIPKVTIGASSSPIFGISNNALMLEANPQNTQGCGVYEYSTSLASQHSEFPFSSMDNNGRCSDVWSSILQSCKRNPYPPSECFRPVSMPSTDNLTSLPLQGGNLSGASSITSLSNQCPDSFPAMHSQGVFSTNTPRQVTGNVPPLQWWGDHNQDPSYHSNVIGSSINSLTPVNGAVDPEGSTFNRNLDFSFCDPLQMKHDGIMELTEENSLKLHQVYTMNQQKSQNNCVDNNFGLLDEVVIAMMKKNEDEVKLFDGDFLCDSNNYSGGTSM